MDYGFLLVHLTDDYSNLLASGGLYARVIYYRYQSALHLMVCYPGNVILPHLRTFQELRAVSSRIMRYPSLHPFAPYPYSNGLPPALDLLEMWTSDYHCYRIFYDTLKVAIPDCHPSNFLSYFGPPDEYVIPPDDLSLDQITRTRHREWIDRHWEVTVAHFLEHRSLLIPRIINYLSYYRQLHADVMRGYLDPEYYRTHYHRELPSHLLIVGPQARADIGVLYDLDHWVHHGGDLDVNLLHAVLQRLLPSPRVWSSDGGSRDHLQNGHSYRGTVHSFSEYNDRDRFQGLSLPYLQALTDHLTDNHLLPGLQQTLLDLLSASSPSPSNQ